MTHDEYLEKERAYEDAKIKTYHAHKALQKAEQNLKKAKNLTFEEYKELKRTGKLDTFLQD